MTVSLSFQNLKILLLVCVCVCVCEVCFPPLFPSRDVCLYCAGFCILYDVKVAPPSGNTHDTSLSPRRSRRISAEKEAQEKEKSLSPLKSPVGGSPIPKGALVDCAQPPQAHLNKSAGGARSPGKPGNTEVNPTETANGSSPLSSPRRSLRKSPKKQLSSPNAETLVKSPKQTTPRKSPQRCLEERKTGGNLDWN